MVRLPQVKRQKEVITGLGPMRADLKGRRIMHYVQFVRAEISPCRPATRGHSYSRLEADPGFHNAHLAVIPFGSATSVLFFLFQNVCG